VPVTVVGAGLAGLVAARELADAGREVVVLDEGAVVGGRLATRSLGGATLDAGAQFFTVRTPELAERVERWTADGLVRVWCHGFDDPPDGHPRYVVRDGMARLAAVLAEGLDVRPGIAVRSVSAAPAGWVLQWDGGRLGSGPVVLAVPVPCALAVLDAGGVALPGAVGQSLRRLTYDPTLAVLAVLDGPPAVGAPGGRQLAEGPFSFVADNARKGISAVPAVTLHARPELSQARFDDGDDAVLADLLDAACPWLGGAAVVTAALERWLHATPRDPWPERCIVAAERPWPLVLAGDAYGGPRVEGAFLSGVAAAGRLLSPP